TICNTIAMYSSTAVCIVLMFVRSDDYRSASSGRLFVVRMLAVALVTMGVAFFGCCAFGCQRGLLAC
ncbi:hypothetical protein EI012_27870, partial [Escherichia coli]|nr:hypothetical protein [Escherichia coli]